MYRIELAPGEETVFRTIEELAVAVRNGLVTPRCRIYHNATQKWLPIEFHPHYKRALSLPAARIAEAVAPRTSGHPPRLETLSFAVTPAAKSAPAPEPVAEPTAETRAGDDLVQPSPLAERSVQDRWPAKRPVGARRAPQQGAERHGAERSDAGHSRMESSAGTRHSDTEHSDAEQSGAEQSGAEQSGAEHPGADTLDVRHAGVEHPFAGQVAQPHLPAQHPFAEQLVPEHPAPKQPATDHAAREHAGTTHSAMLHAAADEVAAQAALEHPVVEHPSVAIVPTEHPGTQRPEPTHSAAEHRFGPHADMAPLPCSAEPASTPKSKSSYRPDSYLPPSVRIAPDDAYVATAPEPATAPPVHTEPVKAWPVMPAVQPAPELPTISYPEFTPAEEPVAERASSSRGHRPLQVAVALLVLAAGGYLARSFYSPVRGPRIDNSSTRAAAVADRPALPEDAPPPAASAVTTKLSPDRPATVPTAPASSGFAAALEPRAIATGPAPILAHATTPGQPPLASTTDSTVVTGPIAPAPVEMPMDVPALPDGDSLVAQPRPKSDSAMKRILRAVTGGKDAR